MHSVFININAIDRFLTIVAIALLVVVGTSYRHAILSDIQISLAFVGGLLFVVAMIKMVNRQYNLSAVTFGALLLTCVILAQTGFIN